VLERAHGVDAVELALRSAAGGSAADTGTGAPPRRAVTVQLRSTLPPGRGGRVTGRLPRSDRHTPVGRGVEVVAVSGYDPGDRLDGWYDALLATVSVAAPSAARAASAATEVLLGLPDSGVPHDGEAVRGVLQRIAGSLVPDRS
jgi:biotin carboxylase